MAAGHGSKADAVTIPALARLLCSFDGSSVSQAALHQAQLLLLDTLGCGFAGLREDVAQAVSDVTLASGGAPECPLIGRRQRTNVLSAVLVNGVAVRVLDLNDYIVGHAKGYPEAAGHPSDNIPVALALGSQRGCSGAEILAAIIIGYELYARLQGLMDRGGTWDGVTVSAIVAAAMAGRLMGLDDLRLAHALALAASRAPTPAIVRSGDISSAKALANSLVAQAGVQAALLAERGLTGPLAILDDARGLRDLFGNADRSSLAAPLPADGAILNAHIKAYPCINTGQSAVAAALKLHAALDGTLGNVERIELAMADYPVIKRQQEDPGRLYPVSRESADHSFPFLVAVTLLDGAFGVAQFERERWHEPGVKALMAKIVMTRDSAWNVRAPEGFPCTLRAQRSAGTAIVAEVPYPPGFSKTGLDANAVIEKFHATAAPVLARTERTQIVDAVMEFPHSRSTTKLDAAIATEGSST